MSRPKNPDPRTEKVQFRASVAEIVMYEKAAEKAHMRLGDYARAVMKSAARTQQKHQPPKPAKPRRRTAAVTIEPLSLDAKTYHQIRLLGVNVNQIAHRLNTFDMPAPPELGPLLADIRRILADSLGSRGPK